MKKYDIYGIGNALVDMEYAVNDSFLEEHSVEKGLMTLVEPGRQIQLLASLSPFKQKNSGGGSAANTIFAANYFGASCFYSCKVANDDAGNFFKEDLAKAGVTSNLAELELGTTGKCLVFVTPDAERTMNTYLGISETVSVAELDEDAIAQSKYVYLEGYLVTSDSGRAAAIQAREIAQSKGIKTALTLSDPAMAKFFKDGLAQMLGDGVDLLFCNEEEALVWADTSDFATAVSAIKAVAKTFAITLGNKGALVFDGKDTHEIAPYSVTAVDSNGAGDMFAGAFLYGLSKGWSFPDAGRLASLASSKVVSQFGPRLPAEKHRELLQSIEAAK